ncbi:MAG: RES family NAD+ phosphorylase [Marinobacterium sp.]|uniref:RES family NAD+ phosphorylase n=1 Tax=Marinobacterium TaxID=48075 RepID=UPI001A8F75DB|nr:RES family NAD+ phosphorylase [Marinobacterium iners]
MRLTGWRIADPAFASTPEAMLSGEGAFLYGGRWNSKGVRVVYLGTSLAQAALELLVHLRRPDILRQYAKLEVSFDAALVTHIDLNDLPDNWNSPQLASAVRNVGDNWVKDEISLVMQVPSAAIHGEYNYLLNPAHPDISKIRVGAITQFDYDPRLTL